MSTTSQNGQGFTFLDVERALDQVGDVAALHEMLDMLQDSLERDVPKIAALLAEGNVKSANRLLHALKGFIPIFCIDALCDHVTRVETFSKTASAEDVTPLYAVLRNDLEKLQSDIDHYMG
ncbi:Hpt domain-containing protein [Rhodoferax aquaticus]|uniref:Hpt domain-containing protein n=1 Tax=Rhodoferax aquaticus TaxID=2527691 RepID=A0A515EPK8_9BURK|nr:Hpt domain-containing protein [Rhodoferax aquaticus]QDL54579.1 Hpt domain-containing protein [Rhodoferax aquaticus]